MTGSFKKEASGGRIRSSALLTIGYLLSPLSWWNDLLINLPIAYLFGLLCGLVSPRLFGGGMVAGYWLTNVAGLLLLHRGTAGLFGGGAVGSRRELAVNLVVSAIYTILIVVLIRLGVLRFPWKGWSS